ncbi:hypothetical protein RB597_000226 [Gaeumannomyces tritici]
MTSDTAAASASIPNLKDRLPKLEPRRRRPPPSSQPPPPQTPTLPPPSGVDAPSRPPFCVPKRRILSKRDHELFLASPTHDLILAFVFGLSDAVCGTPISGIKDVDLSPAVRAIVGFMDEAEELVGQSPPDDQGGSRFGNKRFRDFLDKVRARAPGWHRQLLSGVERAGGAGAQGGEGDGVGAGAEATAYLCQAFGNRARIDYGSGHELNFAMWLLCLYQLGVVARTDFGALVLRVFVRYLGVMRLVQSTYYLEPAGSHGVWGLDDYQFLPFLFGASQLLRHPYITPRAIHQQLTIEEAAADYMYLDQVAFVNSTKTVRGLRWHSPMLDDISAVRDWSKVEGGMRRMFVAEVLGKLPVMQHFLFGSLIPAADGMTEPTEDQSGAAAGDEDEVPEGDAGRVDVFTEGGVRHMHQQNGWGECCGIKVPSSVAAAAEMKKRGLGGEGLRRIPFD